MTTYTDMPFGYPGMSEIPLHHIGKLTIELQRFLKDNFGLETSFELHDFDKIVLSAKAEEMRHLF